MRQREEERETQKRDGERNAKETERNARETERNARETERETRKRDREERRIFEGGKERECNRYVEGTFVRGKRNVTVSLVECTIFFFLLFFLTVYSATRKSQ